MHTIILSWCAPWWAKKRVYVHTYVCIVVCNWGYEWNAGF